ncbi:hypothetical protein pdam_00021561 [Pocillopora damicornis]|uniref:Uncharacterized protein n=1 Tax=Pocillopora damicornis TaxID=46731 RepID=A0A3M6T587_POCDA|nr:hypothetical protein pdam_00021561 [Pocillopora damicornis]
MGKTPKIPKINSNKRQLPKWKTSIENQIKSMRAELSIQTDMVQKDKSDGIQHSKIKEKTRKEYNRTVRLILRTEPRGRNKWKLSIVLQSQACIIVLALLTRKYPHWRRLTQKHANY